MTALIVHTKSESLCVQCEMTVKAALREGLVVDERPGIDTEARREELLVFKNEHNLSAAPIVEAVDIHGRVVDRWAGFRPDKIKEHAA